MPARITHQVLKGEATINFANTALLAFRFLEETHGFENVRTDETCARWETSDVFVQIRFDRRSNEVTGEIGQLRNQGNEPPFNFGEK